MVVSFLVGAAACLLSLSRDRDRASAPVVAGFVAERYQSLIQCHELE